MRFYATIFCVVFIIWFVSRCDAGRRIWETFSFYFTIRPHHVYIVAAALKDCRLTVIIQYYSLLYTASLYACMLSVLFFSLLFFFCFFLFIFTRTHLIFFVFSLLVYAAAVCTLLPYTLLSSASSSAPKTQERKKESFKFPSLIRAHSGIVYCITNELDQPDGVLLWKAY